MTHHFISHPLSLTEGDRGERVEYPLELVLLLAEVDAAEERAQAREGVARVGVAVRGKRAQLDGEREGVQLARLQANVVAFSGGCSIKIGLPGRPLN